jgi:hypothetical protein
MQEEAALNSLLKEGGLRRLPPEGSWGACMIISESGGDAALVRHPRSYFRQGCLKGGTAVGLSVFLDQRGAAIPR